MDWLSKIQEALKLSTKYIFAIFIFSLTILIIPHKYVVHFDTKGIINHYASIVVGSCLFTFIVLLIEASILLKPKIMEKITMHKFIATAKKRIKNLDPAEQSLIREFYLQRQNTIKVPIDNPVVAGLLDYGILQQVGNYGRRSFAGMLFSVKISDFIIGHLTPDLINLPPNPLNEMDKHFLFTNRLPFMSTIQNEDDLLRF